MPPWLLTLTATQVCWDCLAHFTEQPVEAEHRADELALEPGGTRTPCYSRWLLGLPQQSWVSESGVDPDSPCGTLKSAHIQMPPHTYSCFLSIYDVQRTMQGTRVTGLTAQIRILGSNTSAGPFALPTLFALPTSISPPARGCGGLGPGQPKRCP